jgi:hypothetical protein
LEKLVALPLHIIYCAAGGRALTTNSPNPPPASAVMQKFYGGAAHEKWRLVPLCAPDDGWFQIANGESGAVITVGDVTPDQPAILTLQPWSDIDSQKWRLEQPEPATGQALLRSKVDDRVLSIESGSELNDADAKAEAAASVALRQRWFVVVLP